MSDVPAPLITDPFTFAFSMMVLEGVSSSRGSSPPPVIVPGTVAGVLVAGAGVTTTGVGAAVSSSSVSAPAGTLFEPWSTASIFPVGTPFASEVENYAAEVAWPGVGINCNVCHVNDSYKLDRGTVGAVVSKPIDPATLKADTNPLNWLTISPKAASCTACHDSPKAISHVTSFGQATFANRSQQSTMLGSPTQVVETCNDCHSSGGFRGVDIVHGQR